MLTDARCSEGVVCLKQGEDTGSLEVTWSVCEGSAAQFIYAGAAKHVHGNKITQNLLTPVFCRWCGRVSVVLGCAGRCNRSLFIN